MKRQKLLAYPYSNWSLHSPNPNINTPAWQKSTSSAPNSRGDWKVKLLQKPPDRFTVRQAPQTALPWSGGSGLELLDLDLHPMWGRRREDPRPSWRNQVFMGNREPAGKWQTCEFWARGGDGNLALVLRYKWKGITGSFFALFDYCADRRLKNSSKGNYLCEWDVSIWWNLLFCYWMNQSPSQHFSPSLGTPDLQHNHLKVSKEWCTTTV